LQHLRHILARIPELSLNGQRELHGLAQLVLPFDTARLAIGFGQGEVEVFEGHLRLLLHI
jgi:hypothetical protein